MKFQDWYEQRGEVKTEALGQPDRPGDYGDTGSTEYPFHGRYSNDHYYQKKDSLTNEKLQELYQAAVTGYGALQTFFEAMTMKNGDTRYMKVWDNFAGSLQREGIYIGGSGSKVPFSQSLHGRRTGRAQ